MSICGPSLFGTGKNQYIKVGNGEFIAIQGSSTLDRLGLSDLRMPYTQLLKGRIVLKKGQVNYLLNHLGLGDNATFLAIKATYGSKSVIEEDNYVSYSYYNFPISTLTFAQLLVLTGNSSNRIPQLYLTNPNPNYDVILDVMVGIIDDTYNFFVDSINQSGTSFANLEYTDIKSFVVGESILINDKSNPPRPLVYFSLAAISSVTLNGSFLIVDDESQGSIFLNFITEYDAIQAQSLFNYILENPGIDIEDIVPLEDNISPIIFFNSTAGATGSFIEFNGSSYSVPYDTTDGFTFSTSISLTTYGTNSILTKSIINDLLIDYITDNRDGTMSLMDSQMILTGNTGVVSQVSQTGTYSLTFNFSDIATNNLEGVIVNLNITS
jgi:hypothetical protein